MRLHRGLLLALLGCSGLAAVLFLWGGFAHVESRSAASDPALVRDAPPHSQITASRSHQVMEWGLWSGFAAAGLAFGSSVALFRTEVRKEKVRRREHSERKAFVRQVRHYELIRLGGRRENT